jgi:hypothetical protein
MQNNYSSFKDPIYFQVGRRQWKREGSGCVKNEKDLPESYSFHVIVQN